MSYPPDASRSCHEADGRSDRSGGSGGATSGSGGGGVYGTLCSALGSNKWSNSNTSYEVGPEPLLTVASSNTNERVISNWKKWSLGLDYLLQDSEGVALFKSYLQYEDCANLLDFWFACQGFRSKVDPSDHRKITQLIKAIYRTYIRGTSSNLNSQPLFYLGKQQSTPLQQNRSEPIRLRSETRHAITERISRKHTLDQTVFDSAQAEVEHFLRTTAYPAFLKSDIYVDFLQTALEGSVRKIPTWEQTMSSSLSTYIGDNQLNTVTSLSECPSTMMLGGKVLPTLDEDRELQSEELSLLHSTRQVCRPPCCHMVSPGDTTVITPDHGHCQHYKKCHLHNPCLSMECSQPTPRPLWCHQQSPVVAISSAAPLTMENLQMTRFYRTELSLQHSYLNQSQNPYVTRPNQEGRPIGHAHTSGVCSSIPGRFHTRPNYVYTHWADAMCPPSMDPRLGNLPSQPPNPYHISYAPVSARDSEHHSLSSDARTDDTHSHTDSSHEGACNRLRALNHRYSSPFHLSRSHNNGNNNKHQNQLSQHHHHQPHQRRLPTTGQQAASSGATGELIIQCTSKSSFPTQFQSLQSNPFCRSPSRGGAGVATGHINYSVGSTGCSMSMVPSITKTTAIVTSNANSNNQTTSEKISQHSTDYNPNNNNNNAKPQHQKHQRRLTRRGTGSRPSGDKTKLSSNNNNNIGGSESATANTSGLNIPAKQNKSTNRSYSMAEHDPKSFAQILTDKLQRLLNSQLVTERLDNLMIETSPNVQENQEQANEIVDVIPVNTKFKNVAEGGEPVANLAVIVTTNCYATNTTNTVTENTNLTRQSPNTTDNKITPATSRSVGVGSSTASSVLQRPWADKLLAAARVQHENTRENAQAILEDHCSRIWAASADRTPSSSGGGCEGSGGGGSGDGSGEGGAHQHQHNDIDEIDHNSQIGMNLNICSTRPHDYSTTGGDQPQRIVCPDTKERSFRMPSVVPYDHETYRPSSSLGYNRVCSGVADPWSHSDDGVVDNANVFGYYLDDLKKSQQIIAQQESNKSPCCMVEGNSQSTNNWTDENLQPVNYSSMGPFNHSGSSVDPSVTKSLPVIVPPWFTAFSQSDYSHRTLDSCQSTHTEHSIESNSITSTVTIYNANQTKNIGPSYSTTSTSLTIASTTNTTSSNDHHQQHPHNQSSTSANTASQSTHSSSTSAVSGTSNSTPGSSGICTNSLVIGYYMGDDPVPYRSLWPSSEITLGQFKQLIPKKKGLFRYFFKKASDEFDSGVVHQEITNEDTILPLWEGKIVAKVERID